MKNEQVIWNAEPAIEIEIRRARKPAPVLPLAGAPARHRRMRIVLPLPPRQPCLAKRSIIAARREAGPAEAGWQAADRNRKTTQLREASLWVCALRSLHQSGENWLWGALMVAATLSLVTGFGAMGRFVGNWSDLLNLIERCLG